VKSSIEIVQFEEHEKVNFYTLKFPEEETEVVKFFDQFPDNSKYKKEVDVVISWLDQVGSRGAHERYFRPEGKRRDDVWAVPIYTKHLRLYVIRLSEQIVILGNGGVKTTATYNEDPHLNSCVELLQEIDRYIKSRVNSRRLSIYRKQLLGDLTFQLKEKTNEK